MSTIITMRCIDQVLAFESTPVIASGGLEEDTLQVSFCSKWDGMTKTAVFWRTESEAYHVLLDSSDTCTVPREVLADEGVFYFGIFGVSKDGRQRTTEAVRYTVAQGAITSGTQPSDPTPDVYTQMLARYAEVLSEAVAAASAAKTSASAATTAQKAASTSASEAKKAAADAATLAGHTHTAADVGAIPVVVANTSEWDMNAVFTSGVHLAFYRTGAETKNTPYKPFDADGNPLPKYTTFQRSTILSYSTGATYGQQVAFVSGANQIFVRRLYEGEIYDWVKVYNESHKPAPDELGVVPSTRKVNGKTLTEDIILAATDVGARPSTWMPTAEETGARPSTWMPTPEEVGAMPVINAESNAYDLDAILKTVHGPGIYKTDGNTPGTPYAKGDVPSNFRRATIYSYSGAKNYGFQVAYPNGLPYILTRSLNNGVWSDGTTDVGRWQKVYSEAFKPAVADISGAAKVEVGSYIGTGTSGGNYPTEITLGFVPKMLWVWERKYTPVGLRASGYAIPCTSLTSSYSYIDFRASLSDGWVTEFKAKLTDRTFSFYAVAGGQKYNEAYDEFYYAHTDEQLNVSGKTYDYMAIG